MATEAARAIDWRFWAGWGLAFVGFPLGGVAAGGLVGGVGTPLEGLLAGAATGAVLGAAQWLALSRRLPLSPRWIAATSAGMAGGLALSILLFGAGNAGLAVPLRGLATGLAVGLAQVPVLRALTPRAPVWAPVVALAWMLGWLTMRAIGVDLTPHFSVFGSSGALVFQGLTGLAVAGLLHPRRIPAARGPVGLA